MTGIIIALGILVVAFFTIRAFTHKTPPTPNDPNASGGSSGKPPVAK